MVLRLPALEAEVLYWAGSGEDAATAGSGTWDENTSVHWRDSTPTGALVKWISGRAAIFQGRTGGSVVVAGDLQLPELRFAAEAGSFAFTCTGTLSFDGAGISNESANEQMLNFPAGGLSFTGSASAGSGSQPARVRITAGSLTAFEDRSTAGGATLVNEGEMHFGDESSLGTAALTNASLLILEGMATSDSAAITNRNQLTIDGNAHDFARAAFSNDGGIIDLSSVTAPAGVLFGSLTVGAGSGLVLGTNRLTVANLNLVDGHDLAFDIGPTGTAKIRITNSVLGNATPGGSRITIGDVGGLTAGMKLTLLDWTGAAFVSGVASADFSLQPMPRGFGGVLKVDGSRLVLEVLPEVGAGEIRYPRKRRFSSANSAASAPRSSSRKRSGR